MKERMIMRRKEEQVKDVKGQGVPCISMSDISMRVTEAVIGINTGDALECVSRRPGLKATPHLHCFIIHVS